MSFLRLWELRQKEVINVVDGQKLGYVCDLDFDLACGAINCIIVPGPCKVFGFIGRESEFVIDLCDIEKVGGDVILVDIDPEKCLKKCL
ncbi:YlmC/YmxH family sporulation protein [[Clostridium] polysaccharolyticum]|uniref:Sporulation protein, YlmC/YmxH family n=1 Tax=[Clostridium] polysaccharolyticum TaxID=29364 RepID=A0A1H9Y2P7_9FIRM|nr:YlmC/YmxH family sporulation protein [[Clostridium] polysaccharolyticum]SES62578.1 sporulation protein, YlmC/YmxH family [[Clostridium] polysaccharolyticum]